MTQKAGASFKAQEVVDHYQYRPPYPSGIYDQIIALSPATGFLIDLGCGEGKIARPMADVFEQVVAVDPSGNMLDLGRSLPNGGADNISWVKAGAEDAPLPEAVDVVTFASSIHWMDPDILFPRLARHLNDQHILAVIQGDEPFEPAWHSDWREFLRKWVPEVTGQELDSKKWVGPRNRHLDHMDVTHESDHLSAVVKQSVEEFILCQHSRDTFAVPRLGARLEDFQRELEGVLSPYADHEGQLEFQVQTRLTIGALPKGSA